MTDDERGEYEDVILNLRRIIKAWEEGLVKTFFDGNNWVFGPSKYDPVTYPTPAEAYAAMGKDGE